MTAQAPKSTASDAIRSGSPAGFAHYAWLDMAIACPADWEILHFGKDYRKGSLLWADRENHRFEVNWARLLEEPSVDRVVSDECSRFLADERVQSCEPMEHPTWNGFEVSADGFLSTRFTRWFPEITCLIEAVFLWPDGIDEQLQTAMLASIGKVEVSEGQHWKAFGIDTRFRETWPLVECKVLPGSASMVFKPREKERYEQVCVERHGMLDQWMKGTVPEWLREKLPAHLKIVREEIEQAHGHTVHTVRGSHRRKGGVGKLLKRYAFFAAAWICPSDGRLHHFRISTGNTLGACQSRCCQLFSLQS